MYPTRRAGTVGIAAAALAGLALLLGRPLLLYPAAGLVGWLLAASAGFLRATRRLDRTLSVDRQVDPGTAVTDDPVTVTLRASLAEPSTLDLRVRAAPPMTARSEGDRATTLPAGETGTTATFTVRVGVAGRHEFGRPSVEAAGPRGLFGTTRRLDVDAGTVLTVNPRTPRNVHVGTGGEEVATAFGEHEAGRLGSGLEPAELREYHPGDAADRIDWKATARLSTPYVREFEAETDRTTALLVDHRASMATGRAGERKLDFAREVALAFLASARALDDPLGCYAVGDAGTTAVHPPGTTARTYSAVRETLETLEPTVPEGRPGETGARGGRAGRSPADARRAAAALAGDDSAFGRRLGPLFGAGDPYVDLVAEDPVFATARTRLTRLRGTTWTVLLTDDSRPTETRETVRLARRGSGRCLVFLTPTVLFEPGGLADLEAAYGRYLEFEGFRRELAALDRVRAFEVGPGDRIGALLADRRRRGTGTRAEVSR